MKNETKKINTQVQKKIDDICVRSKNSKMQRPTVQLRKNRRLDQPQNVIPKPSSGHIHVYDNCSA